MLVAGYTVNSNANWNGSEVVQTSGQNIILVNFNYRVSLWGFLASERVRADGDLNVGLLDQRKMMQWVQDHIAQVSLCQSGKRVPRLSLLIISHSLEAIRATSSSTVLLQEPAP